MKLQTTILLLLPAIAFAGRSLEFGVPPFGYVFLNILNPSALTQTIDIRFETQGGTISLARDIGQTGHLGTICPNTLLCKNTNASRVLGSGKMLIMGVSILGGINNHLSPSSGVKVKINIDEDRGAVVANGVLSFVPPANPLGHIPIAINSGRPF